MSMLFRYAMTSSPAPVVSLHGRFVRPRPLILVTLIGPRGTYLDQGLLDTGADDTVFPVAAAALLGIDLSTAPQSSAAGVGMTAATLHYAEVTIRVAHRAEQREWTAWVGFTDVPLRYPLLGFAGFLQFFHADFRGDLEEVELTVNRLYTGT